MDELVKALRETDFGDTCVLCEHEDMCKGNDCIIIQAADAIEELVRKENCAGDPVFTIDKDEGAPMRAFRFAKDLYERIIEAENLAFMNEIKANTVVINGRKYGMLKDKPGFAPTIIGMKAETKVDMPDEWDFFLQERPPQPKTNADRLRSMTDEELADWLFQAWHNSWYTLQEWLDWLKEEAKDD